ncbi:MAG: Na+/H+ antiporter [Chloroflexi bacterium]|nr:Na+/H+ antiporter [Chloroflexota bacterium]
MKINLNLQSIFRILIIIFLVMIPLLTGCSTSEEALDPGSDNITAQTEGETGEENDILHEISVVIGLLLIASLISIVTTRLRVPYTVGLVLIGLALSLRENVDINISPELILGLLVPPLIFEAAFHIKAKDLRDDIAPIIALAIPGVLITTFLVGYVIAWGTGFPLSIALIFGALVAATDPVAVVALFRSLGVPKRLQVLIEGESLFNDGTAIVIFNLMIVIAITGKFNLANSIIDFIIVAGGGLFVGFVLGVLISQAISRIDDPLIETTLTSALAFGAYILAEQFHVSGVLAVVAAGLVSGNIGPRGMSPTTRILVFNFWEYGAFLANSFVFLLIGLQIDLQVLLTDWQVIVWAIIAVLVARAVGVYGLSWIGRGMPKSYKHVLYWGGLRGAISLALALSLPESLGQARGEIQTMAFGIVLFTLLVQGLTMKPLVAKMKLNQRSEAQDEYERRHARAVMARKAYERLTEMYQHGLLSTHVWKTLSKPLKQHSEALAKAVTEAILVDPKVEAEELDTALRDLLHTQRSSLNTLLREGILTEEIFSQLVSEVDTALTEPSSNLIEVLRNKTDRDIDQLLVIIIQEADLENVIAALNRLGLPVTQLSSIGGFLKSKNITLLIGADQHQEQTVKNIIFSVSRQRVTVSPYDTDADSVTVFAATIFNFDVERYEEF